MLMKSGINPFDSQEAKPYKSNPEILAMTNLVRLELLCCNRVAMVHVIISVHIKMMTSMSLRRFLRPTDRR